MTLVDKISLDRLYSWGFLMAFLVLGLILPSGARSLVLQIMVLCIFGMAYDICLGFTDQCSLGHSVFFGAGAYGVVLSLLWLKVGLIPALLARLLAALLLAVPLGIVSVRLSEAYFVIVTAIISAIFHLLAMDMTWLTGGDDGLSVSLPKLSLGIMELSPYDPHANYYLVFVSLLLSYMILRRLMDAPLGRVFICIRENEKRALFLGYNVERYKLAAFVISGAFSGMAGGLYAMTLRYASADYFSFYWSILPIVWCLIGGLGTLSGCWIGVLLMCLFQYYVSAWFTYYLLIFGVLILVVLRASHRGIVGYLLPRR